MKKHFPLQQAVQWLISGLFLAAFTLAGCTPINADTGLTATEIPAEPAAATASVPTQAPKNFTIGFSNTDISSDYRRQMLEDLQLVNDEYKANGYTNDLVVESANTDLAGQVQQIQRLLDKKANAILVFPADASGLNEILQKAVEQGVLVIAVGIEVDLPGVYNVGIDQNGRAAALVELFAERLGGSGEIVALNPAKPGFSSDARQAANASTLGNYPQLKLAGQAESQTDAESSRAAVLDLLNEYPTAKGILVGDGLALGALQAITEKRPNNPPIITGDPDCHYLNLWNEYRKVYPEFDSVVVANPPGAAAATGLRFAVNLLLGKKVDPAMLGGPNGRNFIVPNLQAVTKDNFDQQYFLACMGKPASFVMDTIMTDEAVQEFFLK